MLGRFEFGFRVLRLCIEAFSVGERGPCLPILCGVISLFLNSIFCFFVGEGNYVEELVCGVSEKLVGVEV